MPLRLSSTGTVFVRRHNRQSRCDRLVEEADLIHATPQYARVRFRNGRKTTVSLRDATPLSGTEELRLTVLPAGESSSGSQFVDKAIPFKPLPYRDELSQNELETSQTELWHEDGNSFSGPGSAADDVQLAEDNILLNNQSLSGDQPELEYYQ